MFRAFALVATLFAGSTARAEELLVFAASSTSEAMEELARDFEKQTGHSVEFSFAGSNDLARQLSAGAPADVFLSADLAQMDVAISAGRVARADVKRLLSNQLVVIASKDGEHPEIGHPNDLKKLNRIALADPQGVPAGVYAKKFLENVGVWKAVEAKVVPTLDARAALAAVEAGRADAGIVFRSDARGSKKVKIELFVPARKTPEIVYPLAKLNDSKHPAAAEAFVEFLQSSKAGDVFKKHGFVVLSR